MQVIAISRSGNKNLFSDYRCQKFQRYPRERWILAELKPISGRADRASATEEVDLGSIPGRVKPKTRKIGIHSFPAWRSAIKETVRNLHRVW